MRITDLIRLADTSLPTSFVYIDAATLREKLQPLLRTKLPDDLHVTLLYLGKLEPALVAKVAPILKHVVSAWKPIEAKLGGFGRFTKGPDGVPYFCTVDAPGLSHLQCDIERALVKAGVANGSEHGFCPHMTLGYTNKSEEVELPHADDLPSFHIGEVYFDSPGRKQTFKFGGK